MKSFDFLIVGTGFAGSVLAQKLQEAGKKVLIIDKRNHIGGNSFDYFDEHGILIHKYGPHYFRTDSEQVWKYLSQFTEWIPHEYIVKASVKEKLYPMPINRDTLNKFFSINLQTDEEAKEFLEKKRESINNPANAEEQVLSLAGKDIYEAFFKNYTIKQWGINPKDLDASVTARIPIRFNTDKRYFTSKYQAMPKKGYFRLFENLLKGIPILLNTSFEEIKDTIAFKKLIYTGPIDKFFNNRHGQLPYRSVRFIFENHQKEFYQDYSQVNYPNDHEYTRIVEIKHATHQKAMTTTIVKEIPCNEGDPFYPIPNSKNKELFKRYEKDAKKMKNTYFIGRLAQYEYLNMDQVVKRTLTLAKEILNTENGP
jgi:UDP-galactopyranose mutase